MGKWNGVRRTLVALGSATLLALPVTAAQAPRGLTALARLQPGQWQLRDLDGGGAPQSICVADPNLLMQVQHRTSPCSRLVIANDSQAATVHYTCPATGFGRTSLRVETPRLAKIDTQGISDNAPFAYRLEARRTGDCAGGRRAGMR